MSYSEAAVKVLANTGNPMTAEEITRDAIQCGLISPPGKTPDATMAAILYVSVRDDVESPFVRRFQGGKQRAVRGSVCWGLRAWNTQ